MVHFGPRASRRCHETNPVRRRQRIPCDQTEGSRTKPKVVERPPPQLRARVLTTVLTAPDAETFAGGLASATVPRGHAQLVLTTRHLPVLAPGRTYQVCLVSPRGSGSAGLRTTATPVLPADTTRLDITTEPATGSPHPTAPPVARIPVG